MKDINNFLKQNSAQPDWTNALRAALIPYFGMQRARQVTNNILPGILNDFRKMLAASLAGTVVREEYTIDENGVVLELRGHMGLTSKKIGHYLDEVRVNGRTVRLNEKPAGKAGIEI